MTDSRLRELERRFQATGSVEDEAAWITERLRVGELARERVELAGSGGVGGGSRTSMRYRLPG